MKDLTNQDLMDLLKQVLTLKREYAPTINAITEKQIVRIFVSVFIVSLLSFKWNCRNSLLSIFREIAS